MSLHLGPQTSARDARHDVAPSRRVGTLPLASSTRTLRSETASLPVLVVFSHLRWSFVYQRPQHLLSRLAGRWRVIFIEEPVHSDGPARLESAERSDHLTVLMPHTPVQAPGFHDDQLAVLEPLLEDYFETRSIRAAAVWLYTPMALPLVKTIEPRCLVYDCMDELSAFKEAPPQLRQRESALLKRADVVFTGGPSLDEAKRGMNRNVHCIPSSVDARHYDPNRLLADSDANRRAQALQGHLAGPRLGYFGVIDERLDPSLVAAVADAHPEWQIVMAGPVVKIDPASLPQRPNVHWLGMQGYEVLPYLLAGWDLCVMPFALNESTRFISPTKTLEYMAGGRPVVSTGVKDVVLLYGHAVRIANGAADFVRACEEVLAEPLPARLRRSRDMATTVATQSWSQAADQVDHLLHDALAQRVVAAANADSSNVPQVAAGGARA